MANYSLRPGSELQNGKYIIKSVYGQGGFGITYEAVQVLLDRTVAIKEFFMKDCCERNETTSQVSVGTGTQRDLVSKFRKKFVREARTIAGFDHPNIVRVIDVFEENGTAYYVMDNLSGGALSSLIKNHGRLDESKAEDYIRQVSDALSYIHSHHTMHLDVKPSNILLNSKGEAVLIDFGISKHYDEAGEQTSSTPIGISKGFAPLEQAIAVDVSKFKPATDIYALGATYYNLLTGVTPPEAVMVLNEGLERPSVVSDRSWRVIFKAMKPTSKDRPQSISEFLALFGGTKSISESEETIIDPKTIKQVTAPNKKPVSETANRPLINEEPIKKKVSDYNNSRAKKSGEGKGNKWIYYLISVLVFCAVVIVFILSKGDPEMKAAQKAQDRYNFFKSEINKLYSSLDQNNPDVDALVNIKHYVDSIKLYDVKYGGKMPDFFCKYESAFASIKPLLQSSAKTWADLARSETDKDEAIKYYKWSLSLWQDSKVQSELDKRQGKN